MTPQLIGTKKAKAFRACERYCTERRIDVQTRDPREKPLGRRELEAIAAAIGTADALIDTDSAAYQRRGLAWMEYDPLEELMEHPELLRQPIVRTDQGVEIDPDRAALDRLFART
ncbi:MAG: arsenate reductase family protein [Alkalispirochaeta sp.]